MLEGHYPESLKICYIVNGQYLPIMVIVLSMLLGCIIVASVHSQ